MPTRMPTVSNSEALGQNGGNRKEAVHGDDPS